MKKQGKQEVKKEENKNKKDETVMYKPIKSYKEVKAKKDKKPKTPKGKKKHPKLKKALKIMLVMFVLLCVIAGRNTWSNSLPLPLGRLGNKCGRAR